MEILALTLLSCLLFRFHGKSITVEKIKHKIKNPKRRYAKKIKGNFYFGHLLIAEK